MASAQRSPRLGPRLRISSQHSYDTAVLAFGELWLESYRSPSKYNVAGSTIETLVRIRRF